MNTKKTRFITGDVGESCLLRRLRPELLRLNESPLGVIIDMEEGEGCLLKKSSVRVLGQRPNTSEMRGWFRSCVPFNSGNRAHTMEGMTMTKGTRAASFGARMECPGKFWAFSVLAPQVKFVLFRISWRRCDCV